jgi:H3 lysine-79-specific histone-lysine N-methyltransferase
MGIFSKHSKIKAPAPVIRIERVPIDKPKPKPKPSQASRTDSYNLLQNRGKSKSKSASPYTGSPSADESRRKKRKAPGGAGSRSPAGENVTFDSDDSDGADGGGDDVILGGRKRRRLTPGRVDLNRKLRHPRIWTGGADDIEKPEKELRIIHAADLANLKEKCKPGLGIPEEEVGIELRYPGARQRERYVAIFCHGSCSRLNARRLTLLTMLDTSSSLGRIRSTRSRTS